jgi:muramoyltetrapeptide carboxypeptidase
VISPPRLGAGSRIALVAPAGPVAADRIDVALERCAYFGFEARLGRHARARRGYLAGSDAERFADLEWALTSPDIDAVWLLRGGYGTMRLLPALGRIGLGARPRAIIGFSDNTTLHMLAARAGLRSFHAPHAGSELPQITEHCFRRVLIEPEPTLELPLPTPAGTRTLVAGVAEGRLTGGNLAMLAALCGTGCSLAARGAIVMLEDVGEPAYRLDRMLTQLLLAGAFDGVAAFGLGQFTEGGGDTNDAELDALFLDRLGRLGVPVLAGLPFGHVDENWTLPFGTKARLDGETGTVTLLEPAVI